MANTYSQIYIHFVFSVQNRLSLIHENWKNELFKYITGIVEQQGHKLYSINGMPDHLHVLISMKPTQSPSELMYHIKRSSSLWINQNGFTKGKFSWQEGFGAFSYAKSQISIVANYIENQQIHHLKKTFREEYMDLLKLFEVEFDERYIFRSIE